MASAEDDRLSPRELLDRYQPLPEALGALRLLIQVNPQLADDILAFAMALGIYAAEAKHKSDVVRAPLRPVGGEGWWGGARHPETKCGHRWDVGPTGADPALGASCLCGEKRWGVL
jgi:hypothetical protein